MIRLRFSTICAFSVAALGFMLSLAVMALHLVATPAHGPTVIVMRLWDDNIASAYRRSFAEFTRQHPDIKVQVNLVAYSSYFSQLRTDIAGRSAADLFWLSSAYFADYADYGKLIPINKSDDFDPAVQEQFSRHGTLWGIPQITDAGIALYYNKDLLDQAGIPITALDHLQWGGSQDTLLPLIQKLTHDSRGYTPEDPRFDYRRIQQWGYNAANDPQGIYLNYLGSAGGVFQAGDRFNFDTPEGHDAFTYLVNLINRDHVSPAAMNTNTNGDFSRNQFLSGHMALFQSGTYNLAMIARQAPFRFGIALLPQGPRGRISVTSGVAIAANAASPHPREVQLVLDWLASKQSNSYLGLNGQAIPALRSAQDSYFHYWSTQGVDISPFFTVLDSPPLNAPHGLRFFAGQQALKPFFDEMFLGRRSVDDALKRAQQAANKAIQP